MTTLALPPDITEQRRINAAIYDEIVRTCAACRVIAPRDALEPVPTRPGLLRCTDEDACRKRYTPRRLAKSVQTEES